MAEIKFYPVGDCSILAEFENEISENTNNKVIQLYDSIKAAKIDGIIECIPAFRSLLINYNPLKLSYNDIQSNLKKLSKQRHNITKAELKTFHIPVCYGGIYGEDISKVSKHTNLSEKDIISIHSKNVYRIYMLGFLPGFPYLGGLDKRLFSPRLQTPRTKIPQGSVGIGGEQTGIYPLSSPGGWQLIGRTPIKLFDANREKAILFSAGDFIKFKPISEEEYKNIEAQIASNSYEIKIESGGGQYA